MEKFLLIMCNFLSCFAVTTIMFQFMDGRYKRNIQKKYVYVLIRIVIIACVIYINLMNISLINLIAWFIVFGVSAFFLYCEDMDKPLRRILECEALMFCMVVCESSGVIFLHWILQIANIKKMDTIMLRCLEVTFSALIIIFFYYMVINRIMKKIIYHTQEHNIFFIQLYWDIVLSIC